MGSVTLKYAFLLLKLLSHLLFMINMENITVILIALDWPWQMWHVLLVRILVETLWTLQDSQDILSQGIIYHSALWWLAFGDKGISESVILVMLKLGSLPHAGSIIRCRRHTLLGVSHRVFTLGVYPWNESPFPCSCAAGCEPASGSQYSQWLVFSLFCFVSGILWLRPFTGSLLCSSNVCSSVGLSALQNLLFEPIRDILSHTWTQDKKDGLLHSSYSSNLGSWDGVCKGAVEWKGTSAR